MTCHECDSQVAENDVFCPFCGISLQSAAKPEVPAVDDSLESTIMIQHADLAGLINTPEPEKAVEIFAADEDVNAEADDVSDPEPEQEIAVAEEETVSESDEPVIDEFPPTPQILNVTNQTSGNLTPEATSDYIFESPEAEAVEETAIEIAEPQVEEQITLESTGSVIAAEPDDAIVDVDPEPADLAEEPVPVDEPVNVTEFERSLADEIDQEDDLFIPAVVSEEPIAENDALPEESAFADHTEIPQEIDVIQAEEPVEQAVAAEIEDGANAEVISEEISLEAVEDEVPAVKDAPADTPYAVKDTYGAPLNTDPFKERIEPRDKGISMPVEELTLDDSFQSTFDSVRIMEKKEPVEKAIEPVSPPPVAADEKSSADPLIAAGTSGISSPRLSTGGETDGKKGSKLKPLSEGVVLNNRYEIVRKIGGGGMGAVYLASDNNLGGVLRAVKEMVQTHIEEEQQEKAVSDFKRESVILSTLDHVSIPTIFDYFFDESESRFYLVMKYISGGDLSSRLRSAPEGKIEEKRVTEWAIQIIDVLDYLHNQPSTIVYRDLKPSNIMIDGNSGRIMLIDFGIARSINQKAEKGVTAVGTMGYAPPELFSGNVEPRSDIYSLGSTMFHLLTGADPQSNPLLIFDFQKNPRPRQINPQLSDQMERILMRAVEYNADARFASAAEMRTVLEEHLGNILTGKLTYGVTEAPVSVSLANQNVFCGFCGQRIVATDLFCAFCGAKQPIAQHGVHSEIYSQSAFTAKLVMEGTSELPVPTYSLVKDENLLGRRDPMSNIFPEVDLSKYDPQTKISRRHAKIWRDGNNYLVEDLGSSNGTILTRSASDSMRLVPNRPQPLTSGDVIKVGDANLHFVVG